MYLTMEEERIYDGEYGWAKQVCMRILAKLGDLFGAEKLIPIDSAHASGVSYKTLGEAPIDFLRALADSGGKVEVETTSNPQGFDPEYLAKRLPEGLMRGQLEIIRILERMGLKPSFTCTPYYLKDLKAGAHVAWAESSAVVYANSVLGAWTNREGGPSALAAAIIGKTPDYGMHRAENRMPNILVELEQEPRRDIEFGALGMFLGKILKDRIPLITGLGEPTGECLKQLGAALASTGMVNMFHYRKYGVSTEGIVEKLKVEQRTIEATVAELTTADGQKPNLIFLGCPQCSLSEIKHIADLIGHRKVREDLELWVCTSRHIKEKAREYVRRIEGSGAKVIVDTCAVVTWTQELGIETIMTNSAKTAHYAPTMNKAKVILAPLEECLKTALFE